MNIVADYSTPGHNGVENFSEAQGTISYSANQPLYASTTVPSFSNVSGITVETANIIYAALPANRPVDASQLFGTTPTVPVDLEDVSKPKISISHSLTPSRRVLVPDKPLEHSLALPQPPHSRST